MNKSITLNPLLSARYDTPYGTIPFDQIKTEHYEPAIREGIRLQKEEIDAITENPETPTFQNTIAAYEQSGRLLQRVINAFNWDKAGKKPLFPDLVVDGAIGPRTLDGLALLLRSRTNEAALVHALNCMQGAHYINLAAGKPSQRRFTDGWLTRTHAAEPLGE